MLYSTNVLIGILWGYVGTVDEPVLETGALEAYGCESLYPYHFSILSKSCSNIIEQPVPLVQFSICVKIWQLAG